MSEILREVQTFDRPNSNRLRAVFEKLYTETDYGRACSERCSGSRYFLLYEPYIDGTVVFDIGCGSGDTVIALRIRGYIGKGFDWITPQNDFCKQEDIRQLNHGFFSAADTILCFDVLEHMEEEEIRSTVSQIGESGRKLILSVSPDTFTLGGIDLQRTRRPAGWWLELLARQFKSVNIIAVSDEPDRKIYICH